MGREGGQGPHCEAGHQERDQRRGAGHGEADRGVWEGDGGGDQTVS